MDNERKSARQRVLKDGQIILNGRFSVIDCTVRDMSTGGACLLVASTIGIPERFELSIDGRIRACAVAWKTDKQVGVSFEPTV